MEIPSQPRRKPAICHRRPLRLRSRRRSGKPTVWPTCSARTPSERRPLRRRDSVLPTCRPRCSETRISGSALLAGGVTCRHRWEALVAPLRRSDLPPAALREWLSRHQRLVERHGDLESLRAERGAVDTDITRARNLLDTALLAGGLAVSTPDESAAGAFARAQQAVNAARKARADHDSVTEQIQAGTAELLDLQKQRQQTAGWLAE